MDKILNFLEEHLIKVVGVPFMANLLLALADGKISDAEYHSLVGNARFAELLILGVVMGFLKIRNK